MNVKWNILSKFALGSTLAITSMYVGYTTIKDSKNYKSIYDLQEKIKQIDSNRYDSLIKNTTVRHSYTDWEYELRLMNESIKTDSLVKKAYFEGAQMVRDSLNKINCESK